MPTVFGMRCSAIIAACGAKFTSLAVEKVAVDDVGAEHKRSFGSLQRC